MLKQFYKRGIYKIVDINRKMGFFFRRMKYLFHPDIHIGKKVRIGKNVKIGVLFGGSIRIEKFTEILDGCIIWTYGGDINIGSNCSINPYTIIYGHGGTTIGDNVLIAGHCMIIPSNHIFASPSLLIREQGLSELGINIENDVWIANGCTILDGVIIGTGSVIGARSVVTKDVEPNTVVVGAPAKKIKHR